MKKLTCCAILAITCSLHCFAQSSIIISKTAGAFPVVSSTASSILIDSSDDWLVQKAAAFLQSDIQKVSGKQPAIITGIAQAGKHVIIVGSIKGSAIVQQLITKGKLHIDTIANKWETFTLQVVSKPFDGVDDALVITGSDKRGTAYGVFELSQQMGVSPWYWWADVPAKKSAEIYVRGGAYVYGPPSVKYRGIFINDEAPAFSGWAREKFGGVNHLVYEKVFELLLRLKANYLWPAMWGNAFNDDDTLNPILADKYGIVMGTTHHEPMLRAQQEWKRYGKGQWNYQANDSFLRAFWTKGIQNMGKRESIVSIGMRGDGDMPMTEGSNIALLERIVKDQRAIIQNVTGKPPEATPQLWALYKEVQDYYDKGMRVPEDVTLLLCDDNWGNIRKLPKPGDKPRSGGYGIYYHFDYVGDPRNYKWINTNNIARVWEQMHLAKEYGADRIWIVNVGDLKPMEYPISFFLDYAWNTNAWNANNIDEYPKRWASKQFNPGAAGGVGFIIKAYSNLNSNRKPELLSPNTYSLSHYNEAGLVARNWDLLVEFTQYVSESVPKEYKAAYYQLVQFPVEASANLNKLHIVTAQNRLYAAQGRALTNQLADSVQVLFNRDAALAKYYNTMLSNGKWSHMMDQTHISYTYWQQPAADTVPATERIMLPGVGSLGMAVGGDYEWWPDSVIIASLPQFSRYMPQRHYIDLFNTGQQAVPYNITCEAPWIKLSSYKGTVKKQQRIWVEIDWKTAPNKATTKAINIRSNNINMQAYVEVNGRVIQQKPGKAFIENDGYVSIEATNFSKAINGGNLHWQVIPHIGKTGDGVTIAPVTAASKMLSSNTPQLQYNVYVFDTGKFKTAAYFSPTIDFNSTGLQYAISIDDEVPQVCSLAADTSRKGWEIAVADNIKIVTTTHHIAKPGWHTLKFWYIDAGLVLQKFVMNMGGLKQSYFGPPETLIK